MARTVHLSGVLVGEGQSASVEVPWDDGGTARLLRQRIAETLPQHQERIQGALIVAGDRILGPDDPVPEQARISVLPRISGGRGG